MPDFQYDFDETQNGPIAEAKPVNRLPAGLKIICIISIVLGVTGGIASLANGLTLATGSQGQANLQQADGPVNAELMQKMQREMYEHASQYALWQVVLLGLHAISAAGLVVGGIFMLKRRVLCIGLLRLAMLVAILYVIGEVVLQIVIQVETLPIAERYGREIMDQAMKQAGSGGAQVGQLPNMLLVGIYVALGMMVVFALVRLAFYLLGEIYLGRSSVRQLMD